MIRLFVGTSANNEDLEAEAVLAYSAKKHCSLPIEITWMRQAAKGPWSGWRSVGAGWTPFTPFRWSVPAVCGYEGKAIYCDVDFFFVDDLAKLWQQPIPDVALVRNPRGKLTTSCILFNCARAKDHIPGLDHLRALPDAHGTMLRYFRANAHVLSACEGNWDSADKMTADTCAVHYTRIETQLHLKHAVPRLAAEGRTHWYTGEVFPHPNQALQALFDRYLDEATSVGVGPETYRVMPFAQATRKDKRYTHHKAVA